MTHLAPRSAPLRKLDGMRLRLLILSLAGGTAFAITPQQSEFFENRIRPVLAQDCYECHSEAGKKKGGLLLDSRLGWQRGGDSGDAIIVGDAGKSLIMQAIRHEHEDLKMPKAGAKLDEKVIADFERWINEGAFDPRDKAPSREQYTADTSWSAVLERRKQWWAFQPVKPGGTKSEGHPVDAFIEAKLGTAGLTQAPPAEVPTILRRLSYIITGLPPTPDEVGAFTIHDLPSTIDRLLASPRYGEKWARHWMDWVRYAETYGSEGDPAIPYAWRYRDYLIRAFNNDVPYPQMVREAVAGDLLPQPRIADGINESALGIAQLRMVLHGFSPTDTLDEMCTFTDNQIDVVSKAFQGLTVSCARCHNHKFDAISQTDFYSWFGIFSSTHPAVIDVNTPERGKAEREQLIKLKAQIKDVVAQAWLKSTAQSLHSENKSHVSGVSDKSHSPDLRKDKWFTDGKAISQGLTNPGEFSIAIDGPKTIARIHPSGFFTDLVSTKERAVLISPTFKCEGGTLWMRSCGGGASRARYIVQNYPRTGTIHKAKEFKDPDDAKLIWRKLDLNYWKGDDIFIQCTTAADMPVETKLDDRSWFGINDLIITKSTEPPDASHSSDESSSSHSLIAAWQTNTLTDAQAIALNDLLQQNKLPNPIPEAAPLIAKYRELEAALPMPTRAPGVLEADARDAPLFIRGDHKQPGALVPRYFLDAIDPTPFKPVNSGRLQLAESLASKSNPLTARVMVNRIWHHVFGRGIVGTTDNFGRLGELPTHPELLDYLAQRFIDSGGSIKDMIRLLVSSKAFQLDDRAPTGAVEKDPDNKLLSHWTVRRLEAEAIRDSIITLTGKLDETLYGEPAGGGERRRSVYVNVNRNNLDDFLTVFDAPVPMSTRGRRDATNVPAQSLALLNSPRIKDWAMKWGERAQGTDDARIRRMFAEAFTREPTRDELAGCLSFVRQSGQAGEQERMELAKLEGRSKSLREKIEVVLEPIRTKLSGKIAPVSLASLPEPLAEWDFEDGPQDLKGGLPLTLEGEARIDRGSLVLDGVKSLARSKPLSKPLNSKTLEAWVMLDDLDQRGGGVITVQDTRGVVFDSIVFGEKDPQCWVAGSNNFKRTQSLNGPTEREATQRAVHLAVVYEPGGKITGYRDGQPYGEGYKSDGPAAFEAGGSEVLIGCRHGGAGGNKMLHGRVLRARLYDRALKPEEIALSRKAEGASVSERDVMTKLSDEQRAEIGIWQQQLRALTSKTAPLREQVDHLEGADQAWGSLALSLINLKEFVYLK